MNLVADVANQALDAIGWDIVIGDLEEGTREAQVLLRNYGQCLRQLLRAAHWNMARKQTPLVLLADATGQTPAVGQLVPVPWIYEYALPDDCMKVRFVPRNLPTSPGAPSGNIVPANAAAPPMAALAQQPIVGARLIPSRFVEATDFNYPVAQNAGNTWQTPGVSPQGRTVILTNVQNAQIVYTALMLYPSNWDSLFRSALVAYLASEVALPIWVQKDRKFGLQVRTQQVAIAKQKIQQARITDGNEGHYSSDIPVDWMQNRTAGVGRGFWGAYGADGGPGSFWGGWDSLSFCDGTAY